jgi:hypothetical protein
MTIFTSPLFQRKPKAFQLFTTFSADTNKLVPCDAESVAGKAALHIRQEGETDDK